MIFTCFDIAAIKPSSWPVSSKWVASMRRWSCSPCWWPFFTLLMHSIQFKLWLQTHALKLSKSLSQGMQHILVWIIVGIFLVLPPFLKILLLLMMISLAAALFGLLTEPRCSNNAFTIFLRDINSTLTLLQWNRTQHKPMTCVIVDAPGSRVLAMSIHGHTMLILLLILHLLGLMWEE